MPPPKAHLNHQKNHHIYYITDKNDADCFVAEKIIKNHFLIYGEALILENCLIYVIGSAAAYKIFV